MFDCPIPTASWILMLAAVVGAVASCFYFLRPYMRAARFANPAMPDPETGRLPKASVVMYCQSPEDVLMETLEAMSRQDYPDYEIVVVCDAGVEYADYISEMVDARYENVYVTFVQPGSHNLSRHKLANTIGIKASKGEVVVTTVANIEIPSDSWLSSLMAPFCGPNGSRVDASLGVTRMDFGELRGPGKWYRQFDNVMSDGLWIGYAADGKGYRGDGLNLALRKSVFFDHKGYSKTIYLHNGDDDVFIREISRGDNLRMVAGVESILVTKWGDSANRVWGLRKSAYSFTSRWLPRVPFFKSGMLMAMQWVVPGCAVGAALTGWPNLWPLIVGAVSTLGMWGWNIAQYRKLARRLGAVRLWWAVVPFMMWRPLGNAIFNYDHAGSRKKNYTWQR